MKKLFTADFYFDDIYPINADFLRENGVEAIVSDLDNTLADYDTQIPDEKLLGWFGHLSENGIRIAIVSNNGRERVQLFCKDLGIRYYWKSGKPSKKTIHRAISEMGAEPEKTVMLGDKLTTDVIGGRLSGIRVIKVKSIKPRWKR